MYIASPLTHTAVHVSFLLRYPHSYTLFCCQPRSKRFDDNPSCCGSTTLHPFCFGKTDVEGSTSGAAAGIQGKHRVWVNAAPDPSTIRWENLDVTPQCRCCLGFSTTILAFLTILISFAMILAVKQGQASAKRLFPDVNCDAYVFVFVKTYER